MSAPDLLNVIFEPGFSTAAEVTEVSGRGVGMDVVRTVIDRLNGTVQISSTKGKGTTIQLRVPLTLASIQTLLFRVGGRLQKMNHGFIAGSSMRKQRQHTNDLLAESFSRGVVRALFH